MMTWLVVGTETIFFLALIMGFIYFAYYPGFDPKSVGLLEPVQTGAFTALLLASSLTYWRVEVNFKQGKQKPLRIWLIITLALGATFLAGQLMEYKHLFDQQLVISQGTFATGFFTLTGFHGLHVLIGLICLLVVLCLAFLGDFENSDSSLIQAVGIYWHFVDVVWIIVFALVYILPQFINLHGHVSTP
ncbi:heme-copper oxidase subunit III [Spirosoma sp. KUDC1026]|uniref:cytochrome c oxidase subunit 3 n=1 Tax=Spirosoma sp. KUDC1026 TaxID=2745947 RepID=UPI001E5C3217|nr:heme-copper oxidase subunit III [Spirosoma sp. KUDC1026]